jgi:hypothetical protein
MASSDDETNKRNAKILSTNVFYNDLCIISKYSLVLFDHKKHSEQFLVDTIEFTHIMLEMLDEYSRGKVLTIQTQKKRRIRNNKAKRADLDEEMEDSDEESEQEENVER